MRGDDRRENHHRPDPHPLHSDRSSPARRLCAPRRSVLRSLSCAGRRLCGLLLFFTVGFGILLAAPAQAQSQVTLVSNTGQLLSDNLQSQFIVDMTFTTGSKATTLAEIDVNLKRTAGETTEKFPRLRLYSVDSNTDPDQELADFTKPGSFSDDGLYTYTAPANTILSANTTYALRFNGGAAQIFIQTTDSDAEDSGGQAGWSIVTTRIPHPSCHGEIRLRFS